MTQLSINWKPTILPDDFILVIDTRETQPLFTRPPKGVCVVRDTLYHGDYSVRGWEDILCVERKKMSDFLTYIGQERKDKTIPKLQAMQSLYWKSLVLELDDVYKSSPYSHDNHERARVFLYSTEVKYGLHIFKTDDRAMLEMYILDRLAYAVRYLTKINYKGGEQ